MSIIGEMYEEQIWDAAAAIVPVLLNSTDPKAKELLENPRVRRLMGDVIDHYVKKQT